MKKTYMKPEVLQTVYGPDYNLCIGSVDGDNATSGLGDGETLENGGNDPGDFSRRRNVWDDEDL